jgi:mannose-1-phosphate guanylyltransferase / mannose-6-phosphate isomerase
MDIENDYRVYRQWGHWSVLERGEGYKIKTLEVYPNKSLSLQYHNHRAETWCIVEGEGKMIIGERTFDIRKHDSLYIPVGVTHKVTNTSSTKNLIIVEVQQGDSCKESDIVRIGETQ